jgi:hypothetical protein
VKIFNRQITTGLKVWFGGFVVAAIGALCGFIGLEFGYLWVGQIAFFVVVFGVLLGCAGIFVGWVQDGRSALRGSYQASKDLRESFLRRVFRKKDSN